MAPPQYSWCTQEQRPSGYLQGDVFVMPTIPQAALSETSSMRAGHAVTRGTSWKHSGVSFTSEQARTKSLCPSRVEIGELSWDASGSSASCCFSAASGRAVFSSVASSGSCVELGCCGSSLGGDLVARATRDSGKCGASGCDTRRGWQAIELTERKTRAHPRLTRRMVHRHRSPIPTGNTSAK